MSRQHLSNDEFLHNLTTLLSTTHNATHGSVFLTQKTLPPTTSSASLSSQVLIRATNGKSKSHRQPNSSAKIKLSTLVEAVELTTFYAKYAEVCKKGMEGLRKRDKKKAKARRKKKEEGKGGGAGQKVG